MAEPPNAFQRLRVKVRNRVGRLRSYRWRRGAGVFQDPAIVIGGCPRSGTTLLRRLLDDHPQILCGPETSLLLPARVSPAELAFSYGLPESDIAEMLAQSESQSAFVARFFEAAARWRGKRRWAEKTPLNVRHLDWIFGHFPNARFIHVIRDGRDVVCSLRDHPVRRFVDGKWIVVPQRRSAASCIDQWLRLTSEGMRRRGDPRYLEVRYEDLVQSPEATMRQVMSFVGEPFEEGWLAARLESQRAGGATEAAEVAVKPNAAGAISTSSLGRWRRDLNAADLDMIRTRATDRLLELGYVDGRDWT